MPSVKTKPMVRRSQEQRSSEMRERLFRATLDLICEVGFEQLTTAMIARRAGVSKGAQTHHFPTKNDLLVGAFIYLTEIWEQSRLAFEAAQPERIPLEDYIRYLWRDIFSKPIYLASIELMLAARGDAELRERIMSVLDHWIEIRDTAFWKSIDLDMSKQDASAFMHLTLAVLRGMAINASFNRDVRENEAVFEAWLAMTRHLRMGFGLSHPLTLTR